MTVMISEVYDALRELGVGNAACDTLRSGLNPGISAGAGSSEITR
jgi:hypothetical protein